MREGDEHVPPGLFAQRLHSMPVLMPCFGLDLATCLVYVGRQSRTSILLNKLLNIGITDDGLRGAERNWQGHLETTACKA
jgi:hypothetical protein